MLTGKDLGAAIAKALELKKARPIDLARHFHVKPPSVQGWLSNGTVSKSRLPELWRYFSDVVGPDHWGMEAWPQGPIPGEIFERPTDAELQLLEDFRILTDADQERFRAEIAERASLLRAYMQREMHRIAGMVPPENVYSRLKTNPVSKPTTPKRKAG